MKLGATRPGERKWKGARGQAKVGKKWSGGPIREGKKLPRNVNTLRSHHLMPHPAAR